MLCYGSEIWTMAENYKRKKWITAKIDKDIKAGEKK